MKKRRKTQRLLSWVLAVIMLVGILPFHVFAEEAEPQAAKALPGEPENQYTKLDWNEEWKDQEDQSYFWPLNQYSNKKADLPYQTLVSVGNSDPVKTHDINYDGYYINADGRLVFRFSYNLWTSANSGVWNKIIIRLDKDLYDKMDKSRSSYYSYQSEDWKKLATTNGEYELTFSYKDSHAGLATRRNNIPIDIVMNVGVTLDNLPKKNYFVQSRLTNDAGDKVYNYAPRGSATDYMTYTRSTIIPFATNVDSLFKPIGLDEEAPIVTNRAFAVDYDPFYGKNTPKEKDSTALLRTQYNYVGRAITVGYLKSVPTGFVMGFDKKLLDYLDLDDSNQGQTLIGSTQLLNSDKKVIGKKVDVKYENVMVEGNTAYIVMVPNTWKQDFNELGVKNILGETAVPVTVNKDSLDEYIIESDNVTTTGGRNTFVNLNLKINNDKLTKTLSDESKNYVYFGAVAGFIQQNQGMPVYEYTAERDMTIPAKGTLDIVLSKAIDAKPRARQIKFQVGEEDSLVYDRAGYYYSAAIAANGVEQVEALEDYQLQRVHSLSGIQIKAGDTLRATVTHDPNYEGDIYLWEPTWDNVNNQGVLKLEQRGKWNIFGQLFVPRDVNKMQVTYTDPEDGLEKKANMTKKLTWQSDNKEVLRIENGAILNTGGTFTLNYDNIDKTKDVHLDVTHNSGTVVRTTITNQGGKFTKVDTYKRPSFWDNTDKIASFVISKASYMPKQDVFTNDYSKVTTITDTSLENFDFAAQLTNKQNLEKFNPFTDNLENFMNPITHIRGYSLYQKGTVTKVLVPNTGGPNIEGFGVALEDEVIEEGKESDIGKIKTDMSTKITYTDVDDKGKTRTETHTAWLYDIEKPKDMVPVKDLKLLFANTASSSLLSDYKVDRVRTRVLFDLNKDQNFTVEANKADDHIVKIVPDNEKYAQETGYTPNGFAGANVRLLNEDGTALTPDEKTQRTFPEDPEEISVDGKTKTFIGWATKKVTADEFRGLEELTDVKEWETSKTADSKGYKFTKNSPVTTHQIVYAIYDELGTIGDPQQTYDQENDKQEVVGTTDLKNGTEVILTNAEGNPITDEANNPITVNGSVNNKKYTFNLSALDVATKAKLHGQTVYVKSTDKGEMSEQGVTLDLKAPELSLELNPDDFHYKVKVKFEASDADFQVLHVKYSLDSELDLTKTLEAKEGKIDQELDLDLQGQAKKITAQATDTMGNKSEKVTVSEPALKKELTFNIRRARAGQGFIFVKSTPAGANLTITITNNGGEKKMQSHTIVGDDYNKIDLIDESTNEVYSLQRGDRIRIQASKPDYEDAVLNVRIR